jgi:hypothetical protein
MLLHCFEVKCILLQTNDGPAVGTSNNHSNSSSSSAAWPPFPMLDEASIIVSPGEASIGGQLQSLSGPGIQSGPTSSGFQQQSPSQYQHVNNSAEALTSQQTFIDFLKTHLKSKAAIGELLEGKYSIAARQAITQVAVSKMIDIYGHSPSKAVKSKISAWLEEMSKMSPTDFFDPKTHKGFLNKDLENRRRKLPAEQKRWVWTKKSKADDNLQSTANEAVSTVAPIPTSTEIPCTDLPELDQDECPQKHAQCDTCGGKQIMFLLRSNQKCVCYDI